MTTTTKPDPLTTAAAILAEDYRVRIDGNYASARSGNVVARISQDRTCGLRVYVYTDYGPDGTSYIDSKTYKSAAGAARMVRRWLG